MDLVSVIIPTYNRCNLLLRSIQSVLEQTYEYLEVIVVDDCSDDETIEMLEKINDPRVSYLINDKNRGACYSRNRGIEIAKGKYIAFQDSDDVWKKDKTEKSLKYLKEKNVDLVFSNIEKFDNNYHRILPSRNLNDEKDKIKALLLGTYVSTQTIVGKKECFEKIKFDEQMPKMQDKDLMIRMAQEYEIYQIAEPLVVSYLQDDSITKNYKDFVAIERMFKKYSDVIMSDEKIASSFYYTMGKAKESNKENGSLYFKKAILLDKNKKKYRRAYMLSKMHLYHMIFPIKEYAKGLISKMNLWKYFNE